jgi:hypothetical protein
VFAIERISITTDDGIVSVPAGTRLRVVSKTDTGWILTDGNREFPAQNHQVSTETAAVNSAVKAQVAERSANAAAMQAQLQAQTQVAQTQQQQAALAQQAAAKEKRIRDLETNYDGFLREEAALTAKIEEARQDDWRAATARSYGRVYTRSVEPNQRVNWAARLAVVREEKRRIQNELDRIRYQ